MVTSRAVPIFVLGLSWAVGLSTALAGGSQSREPGTEPVTLGRAVQDPPPAKPRPARTRAEKPKPTEKPPVVTPIVLRTSEPVRFAFREHLGPYWTVGRVVSSVARDLREADRSVPIVVRYMGDPARTAPDQLVTRIGWFAEPREPAIEGFRIEPIGEEELACLTSDAKSTKPLQTVTEVRNWIANRAYEPVGPVYEIHHPAEPGDSGSHVETCVVARPVGSAPAPVAAPEAIVSSDQPVKLEPHDPTAESEKVAPRQVEIAIPIRLEPRQPAPPATETNETSLSPAVQAEGEAKQPEAPTPAPDEASQPMPEDNREPVSPPSGEQRHPSEATVHTEGTTTMPPPAAPQRPAVDAARRESLAELLRAGNHEAVAGRIMPENRAWGRADCAFVGAVVTRIEALAGRLRTKDAGTGASLVPLAAACSRQWQERCSSVGMAARVAFRIDPKDPQAAQKRAVLSAMDGVMAAVGAGAFSADQIRDAVASVLESVAAMWE